MSAVVKESRFDEARLPSLAALPPAPCAGCGFAKTCATGACCAAFAAWMESPRALVRIKEDVPTVERYRRIFGPVTLPARSKRPATNSSPR